MAEWSRQEDTHDRVMERKERVDLLLDHQRCHQLLQCESRSPQCASAVPPTTIKVYKKTKIQLQTGAFTGISEHTPGNYVIGIFELWNLVIGL